MAPRSLIWKHFTRCSNELSQCNICFKKLKTSGNTTNLGNHLRQKHNDVYSKIISYSDLNLKKRRISPLKEVCNVNTHDGVTPPSPSSTITLHSEHSENEASTSQTVLNAVNMVQIAGSSSGSDITSICSSSSSSTQKEWPISYSKQVLHATIIKQPTIAQVLRDVSSFSDGGSKHIKITETIIKLIVHDNLPFNIVEGKGFINLMKEVAPLYKVPTRNTVKDRIDKKYETVSLVFKNMIKDIDYFALTTDIWTADMQNKSFMGVTVHFVTEREICSATLGVTELSESRTAIYIAEKMSDSLKDWNINSESIVEVITDNGANMVKACQDFLGKHRHVPCFAHTINLVYENSIKNTENLPGLIEKVRAIVVWFKLSVYASDELRKAQKAKGIVEGNILKLILDIKTRWNSTYFMIERFLRLAPLIGNIILSNINAPNMISATELDELKQICQLLLPLEQTTREMSAENYVTLSKVIPMVKCLQAQYREFTTQLETVRQLRNFILKELEKRFVSVEKCFLRAAFTILDPRFKNLHFNDPIALSNALIHLKNEISAIAEEIEESFSSSDLSDKTDDSTFDLWAPHKSIAHTKKGRKVDAKFDELTQYLTVPVRSLKENPFELWDEMKLVYPKLYKLSQKYLFMLATSVPSERLFSKAGAIATKNRSRLTGKRLSKLLFLTSLSEKIIKW